MTARILDASNLSLSALSAGVTNAAAYSVNFSTFGESNGLGPKGGNANTDAVYKTSSGMESGLQSMVLGVKNTSAYTTSRGFGAYFVPPKCTGSTSGNIDIRDSSDGRTHTTVDKVHCTWRVAIAAFASSTGVAHYNHVPLGVYDTAGTLIAGIRLQHRGEMYCFYLEPWLADSSKPASTLLAQIRTGLGSADATEHATSYFTIELVVDTTLASPTSDSTRAAARVVLPTGQAQPWVVQTWDSSDQSLSANACDSWQGWSTDKDATAGAPTYEPTFTIDSYHHVEGSDWWANYDTHGVGYDGFGHGVKIAELKPASDVYQDASGWTKSAGATWYTCIDDLPFSLGDYVGCTVTDKIITFGMESFLTKVGWTASPYGEVLGVVPKVLTSFYNATDYYYGSNVRYGVCNASNATYTQSGSLGDSYGEGATGSTRQLITALGVGVNEKPTGGAWDPSSIDTDLRLWLKSGPFYGSALKYPTVYDACVYVLYREPQRAVGSSSGGQGVLTGAPTLTRAKVASGAGRDCSRIDTTGMYRSWELPTLDSNGVTMNWTFGDYSPLTGKYYVCAWDKNLWNNQDPYGAGTGRYPCVAEVDPATGSTKIIWSAGESTTGASATDGGPHQGASGGWYWQSQGTGGGEPRAQRPHFLKIDKRPKFADGTTNPFYGHIFCSFLDGANGISAPVLQNMGTLWLDPSQARTGDYCKARFLPWERTSGDSNCKGALGLAITEDYVYLAAPYERGAVTNSVLHRFNKKNLTTSGDWSSGTVGSGYPIQDQAADWDAPIDTGIAITQSALQPIMNQLYYLGGTLWSACPAIRGWTPGDEATSPKGPWFVKAGTGVNEFNIRQFTIHPVTGNLWGYGQWNEGTLSNTRIKDWADTYENSGARTGLYGTDVIGVFEMNPSDGTVLRYWRIPVEIADDSYHSATASLRGAWRKDNADAYCPHGAHWIDENTLLLSVGEHRSPGDIAAITDWPRSTLFVFRRDEETWHQVTKPATNQNTLVMVDALATDRGTFSSGSANAPANRHDLMSLGGASPVQNPATWDTANLRYKYVLVDTGFGKAGSAVANYAYAQTGSEVGAGSKGHVIEVTAEPPLLRENEIEISATIDLTGTSITSINEWAMHLRSGGTIGQGSCFASGGAITADAGGKVRIRGYIQASEWTPGGSSSDIDVFWQVTSSGRKYWNSRSTS